MISVLPMIFDFLNVFEENTSLLGKQYRHIIEPDVRHNRPIGLFLHSCSAKSQSCHVLF